ncbi:MAG: hypothetical protein V1907_04120 [Candidatus Kerfeldbacteria bacterium]
MRIVISHNNPTGGALRAHYAKRGYRNVQRFSWEKTAAALIAALQ